MRRIVVAFFNDELKRVFETKPTMLDFLTKHERKNMCIDNICHQVILSERRAKNHLADINNLERFVRDLARIFASTCIEHKKEELLTSLARQGKISEINRISELEKKWDSYQEESTSSGVTIYPTFTKSTG